MGLNTILPSSRSEGRYSLHKDWVLLGSLIPLLIHGIAPYEGNGGFLFFFIPSSMHCFQCRANSNKNTLKFYSELKILRICPCFGMVTVWSDWLSFPSAADGTMEPPNSSDYEEIWRVSRFSYFTSFSLHLGCTFLGCFPFLRVHRDYVCRSGRYTNLLRNLSGQSESFNPWW